MGFTVGEFVNPDVLIRREWLRQTMLMPDVDAILIDYELPNSLSGAEYRLLRLSSRRRGSCRVSVVGIDRQPCGKARERRCSSVTIIQSEIRKQ
jgi:hypothetical protein